MTQDQIDALLAQIGGSGLVHTPVAARKKDKNPDALLTFGQQALENSQAALVQEIGAGVLRRRIIEGRQAAPAR